ncbi:hypothetical protein [Saliterribacillus persicus]|uniref:Uncharacterized protein n=1 Tax=Saliterribacillus persicus TaxID=930114 RepID=A0A368X854_9BACI|nr:hypothetical protein [Saliterribacillus persicus]RCW62567.1 hypothetical protein DFR57_12510 [Saliterribacillus persicus]
MKYTTIIYISVCVIHLMTLTNITLLNSEWDGITIWLSTAVFIFSTTIFSFSRKNKHAKE